VLLLLLDPSSLLLLKVCCKKRRNQSERSPGARRLRGREEGREGERKKLDG
jgi:hypothetical protein